MRKNSHGKILRGELKEQHLSTVPISCPYKKYLKTLQSYKGYLSLDVAEQAVRVRSIGFAGQTGRGWKHVIFKWVAGRVYPYYKNKSMTTYLERINKIN